MLSSLVFFQGLTFYIALRPEMKAVVIFIAVLAIATHVVAETGSFDLCFVCWNVIPLHRMCSTLRLQRYTASID